MYAQAQLMSDAELKLAALFELCLPAGSDEGITIHELRSAAVQLGWLSPTADEREWTSVFNLNPASVGLGGIYGGAVMYRLGFFVRGGSTDPIIDIPKGVQKPEIHRYSKEDMVIPPEMLLYGVTPTVHRRHPDGGASPDGGRHSTPLRTFKQDPRRIIPLTKEDLKNPRFSADNAKKTIEEAQEEGVNPEKLQAETDRKNSERLARITRAGELVKKRSELFVKIHNHDVDAFKEQMLDSAKAADDDKHANEAMAEIDKELEELAVAELRESGLELPGIHRQHPDGGVSPDGGRKSAPADNSVYGYKLQAMESNARSSAAVGLEQVPPVHRLHPDGGSSPDGGRRSAPANEVTTNAGQVPRTNFKVTAAMMSVPDKDVNPEDVELPDDFRPESYMVSMQRASIPDKDQTFELTETDTNFRPPTYNTGDRLAAIPDRDAAPPASDEPAAPTAANIKLEKIDPTAGAPAPLNPAITDADTAQQEITRAQEEAGHDETEEVEEQTPEGETRKVRRRRGKNKSDNK
jgi:hypothetical protein